MLGTRWGGEGTGELDPYRTVPYQSLAVFMQLQFESRSTGSRPVQCRSRRGNVDEWADDTVCRLRDTPPRRSRLCRSRPSRISYPSGHEEGWRRSRRVWVFSRHPHLRTSHLSRSEKQQAVGWLAHWPNGRMTEWPSGWLQQEGFHARGGAEFVDGIWQLEWSRFPVNWKS